jgi:phenylpyruvate tautomerase PptA (4-oxalocrotonate tautomerase family)
MPYIEIDTNVTGIAPENIEKKLGRAIELLPGKTERWLMIRVNEGQRMAFAGSAEPCALAVVSLFGKATDKAYADVTAEVTKIVAEETGIPADRIYVKFEEVSTWGWSGSNF